MNHWTPSTSVITQTCHFAVAWAIVATLHLARVVPFGAALTVVVLWALVKEFAWDIVIEQDSWTESFRDFFFYLAGGLVAEMALCLLKSESDR